MKNKVWIDEKNNDQFIHIKYRLGDEKTSATVLLESTVMEKSLAQNYLHTSLATLGDGKDYLL